MESMLGWMKNHDHRYRKTFECDKDQSPRSATKATNSPMTKQMGPQKTLKAFLPTKSTLKSEIFDDTFNQADFALVTHRWKEKNTEHVAAQ